MKCNLFSKKPHKFNPLDKKVVREYNKIRSAEKHGKLCHAPFKSMTFFHTGDVLACWHNKLYPLGHYPENSIQEIWNGSQAKKLREYIGHYDMSYGCAECRKNILAGNYYSGAWRYDYLPEGSGEFPVSIDFQISNLCNLECVMCNGEYSANVRQNREKREAYEKIYDDDFFSQIAPFIPHLKEVSFSGGEPFFAGEFYRVWDLLIEKNPEIVASVTTNGNVLNDKVRKYLNALSFNISVSVDAISEELYRKIRINGHLPVVLKNIDEFHDYTQKKGTTFNVKTCVMRQNYKELPALANYFNERDISFLYNTVFYPPYCSLWNLSSAKLNEIVLYLKSFSFPENSKIQKGNNAHYRDMIKQIERWQFESSEREKNHFNDLGVQQLMDMFLEKVKVYLSDELLKHGDDCPVSIPQLKTVLEQIVKDSPSEKITVEGLRYYASAPIERLLGELAIRDYEKVRDRFFQIGQFSDVEFM